MTDSTAGITLSLDGKAKAKSDGPVRQPQLIVAFECSRPFVLSSRHSLDAIQTVHLGRRSTRVFERTETEAGHTLVIGIPDRWMSSAHARIERSFGRWVLEDAGSKNGTIVNGEPVMRTVLRAGDLIELGHTLFLFYDAEPASPDEPADLDLGAHRPRARGLQTLVGELAAQLGKLQQVAGSNIPIMIEGASGTGKEVLARAVHALSGRGGQFVAVNCGAIPVNLVESELFGHRKGSFSGAVEDRPGLIRSADTGTLFLDEIGDLPAASQAALLRVLQEREVTPVGGARPIPVDIRVMAATHRDLDGMVAKEEFRRDLFARLAGFRVTLPSLRDRRRDIGLLIAALLAEIVPDEDHPGFESDAVRRMFDYSWPLNIRELEQCLRTATVLASSEPVSLEHLPEALRCDGRAVEDSLARSAPRLTPEDEQIRDRVLEELRSHRGNISAVARAMGKDRKQIQRWVKRFRLDPAEFR